MIFGNEQGEKTYLDCYARKLGKKFGTCAVKKMTNDTRHQTMLYNRRSDNSPDLAFIHPILRWNVRQQNQEKKQKIS